MVRARDYRFAQPPMARRIVQREFGLQQRHEVMYCVDVKRVGYT